MIQEVHYCSNCKSILIPAFIYIDGKETYTGIYSCHVCNRIDMTKEFIEEIYKKFMELEYENI